jgi:hypothetical protein
MVSASSHCRSRRVRTHGCRPINDLVQCHLIRVGGIFETRAFARSATPSGAFGNRIERRDTRVRLFNSEEIIAGWGSNVIRVPFNPDWVLHGREGYVLYSDWLNRTHARFAALKTTMLHGEEQYATSGVSDAQRDLPMLLGLT